MTLPDLITLASNALPAGTRVVAVEGVEAVSRPYELDIHILTTDDWDLAAAVGATATLKLDRQDGAAPWYASGVLAEVELVHEVDAGSLVRAVMVPRLWLLGLSRHSRVFTKMSIPDILAAILDENDVSDYELRLGSYEVEEHVCQYRESDLAFISRWMEREGIFYYFEHGEGGEKLILSDSKSYGDDPLGAPVRYHPARADATAAMSLRTFKCLHSKLPASVRVSDYNYANPSLDVSGSAMVSASGTGEVSVHGDRFFTPSGGARLARVRAEELAARSVVYRASGTRSHLRPGQKFEIEEHPRAQLNADYVAVEVRYWINQAVGADLRELLELPHDEVFFADVEAIPAATQFRAASVTPWPRIYGVENGVVDGPADSPYAQIDADGRYAVKLSFDESDLDKGNASTYLRMMQPHGGATEGFHFPLRKGTEVIVAFSAGDPDRPFIQGVVPNAVTPSPVTSKNNTLNVLQTGGRNLFELEDEQGEERILLSTIHEESYLHMGALGAKGAGGEAPKFGHEIELHTLGNIWVNAGATMVVDAGITKGAGELYVNVQDDYSSEVVAGNYELLVKEGMFATTVKGDSSFTVQAGNWIHDVSGSSTTNVGLGWATTIEADATLQAKGTVKLESVSGPMEILAREIINIEADYINTSSRHDTRQIAHANNYSSTYGMNTNIFMGQSTSLALSNTTNLTAGLSESLFIGGKLELNLAGIASATAGLMANVSYGGILEVKGPFAIEYYGGLKLAIEQTVSLEMNYVAKLETSLFKMDIAMCAIEQDEADLKFSSIFMVG